MYALMVNGAQGGAPVQVATGTLGCLARRVRRLQRLGLRAHVVCLAPQGAPAKGPRPPAPGVVRPLPHYQAPAPAADGNGQ